MLNFEVGKDLYNSDHFPLLVSHVNRVGTQVRPPTYHFHRADWNKFTWLAVITGTMVRNRAVDDALLNVYSGCCRCSNFQNIKFYSEAVQTMLEFFLSTS
ncbi:hypothetical protein TNCV_3155711 [Trichonephila clavipes]|nr:hypothetical protein TNCV_3155711 [Trichonephila clavipes]